MLENSADFDIELLPAKIILIWAETVWSGEEFGMALRPCSGLPDIPILQVLPSKARVTCVGEKGRWLWEFREIYAATRTEADIYKEETVVWDPDWSGEIERHHCPTGLWRQHGGLGLGRGLKPDVASFSPSCLHCLLSSSPARRLARDIFKVRKICFCEKFYTEMPADAHYKTASSLSEGKRRVKTYAESFQYKYWYGYWYG